MSEAINEAELGRGKKGITPADHLQHLLGLGWAPDSPLIRKYVLKYRLQAQLAEWVGARVEGSSASNGTKLKNSKV